jgi:cell division protein ZapE
LHSIAARLADEVAAARLTGDDSQQAAAAKLDLLNLKLARTPRLRERLAARVPLLGAAPAAPCGLYLWGGVGRGKTLLMDLFYDALNEPKRARTHFYRFMREVHAELRGIKDVENPLDAAAARIASRARVICLDEFFVADIGDAMILAGLLQGLFARGVTLIATSNVPPRQLYRDGLQRQRFLPAIDLIERHVEVFNLDGGTDYRLRELQQAPTYLPSAAAPTRTAMAGRFAALAGGSTGGATLLSIEERHIAALATAPGMVWFEFAAICEGPRSQNDYIELARLYHTVFISDVPVFTSANENAARRFIMLIDEFYDRNVNIVLSAAAAPAALYQGERLRFEFERAASRLIEMQTQHYLAGEHRP